MGDVAAPPRAQVWVCYKLYPPPCSTKRHKEYVRSSSPPSWSWEEGDFGTVWFTSRLPQLFPTWAKSLENGRSVSPDISSNQRKACVFPHVDTQIVSPITASRGRSVTCSKTPTSDAPYHPLRLSDSYETQSRYPCVTKRPAHHGLVILLCKASSEPFFCHTAELAQSKGQVTPFRYYTDEWTAVEPEIPE